MAKKENFQEYVTRTQNEIAGVESKIEAEELKKLQLEHKMQRLQNVTEYKVNKSKKARVSRLITRGAAIECICKDVELLDKAEFFLLVERIFSDPVLCDEIAKMVVGRRNRIEAGEAELQSTIEDLKEPLVSVCEKYTLTIREAAAYFNIGIKKMRRLAEENTGRFSVFSGNKHLIIRHKFEKFIDDSSEI